MKITAQNISERSKDQFNIFPTPGRSNCPSAQGPCEGAKAFYKSESTCEAELALLCLALLVHRKFSSGPPSEAAGGQHC